MWVEPDDGVKRLLNEWTLRGLILFSLALQMSLIPLGIIRRYNPRIGVRFAIWFAYLPTFWIATAGLGVIMGTLLSEVSDTSPSISSVHKLNSSELVCFWVPFLLLHLGGPDAITAIELQDNELYLVYLIQTVFQSATAIYILLASWDGHSDLPQLSVLVLVAGFIKCSERVQAQRLAKTENLRDSMLGPADPGPNYPKFIDDLHLKKSQRFSVKAKVERVAEALELLHLKKSQRFSVKVEAEPLLLAKDSQRLSNAISKAYDLFQTFKNLFVDLVLTFEDRDSSQSYFRGLESGDAFRIVEIELGFAYDMLCTKANVVYTSRGILLRLTCFCCLLLLPGGFYLLCDVNEYLFIDVFITYLLIGSAILMEIVAFVTMLRSDWTDHWLSQKNLTRDILIFPFLKRPTKRRWSGSISQLDLLSVALDEKLPKCLPIQKLFGIDNMLVKHRYTSYSKVSDNLKHLIYSQICEFMVFNSHGKALRSDKGSFSLRKNECKSLIWTITRREIDHDILKWHIATTLCYYSELDNQDDAGINTSRRESKHISDYLLHLLVSYPVMLPLGMGMISYRDTCAEATRFFKEKASNTSKVEACRMLLQVESLEVLPPKVKGDRSKSVFFDGCRLALSLKKMERRHMWEFMSQVWVENLVYAAAHCRRSHHSQQLSQGGEFLTHVWLLMAHLGLYQVNLP